MRRMMSVMKTVTLRILELNNVPITKLKRMACLAHTAQLVYKDRCKINSVLLAVARCVVKIVRLHLVMTEELKRCSQRGALIDCPARWDSKYSARKKC